MAEPVQVSDVPGVLADMVANNNETNQTAAQRKLFDETLRKSLSARQNPPPRREPAANLMLCN
jgi:hypothetical protein